MKQSRMIGLFCGLGIACSSLPTPSTPPNADIGVADVGSAADTATSADTTTGADPDAGPDSAGTERPLGSALALSSTAFADKGTLPAEFTCDGMGVSPPLAWSGIPKGTVELALLMTTEAKDGTKWNWVLYGIPPVASGLTAGQTGVGSFGLTSDGPNLAYAPPCSQGPGAKVYTFTLYALSAKPVLPQDAKQITGPVLGAAIQALTLASASVSVSYTRPN